MAKFKDKAARAVSKFMNVIAQAQEGNRVVGGDVDEDTARLLRRAAAEGAVLLKNDGVLPLNKSCVLSVFGRVQRDYFFTGYGSGGDVVRPYQISPIEGLRQCADIKVNAKLADYYEDWCLKNPVDDGFWGHWPRYYPEMPLDSDTVMQAAENSDCAAVVIGRSSGEDRENTLEKGSYYFTDAETDMLEKVTAEFKKTVVILNIGSVVDLSALNKFGEKIGAVLIVWQGGMESGAAIADLLCGKVNPCGCLTDTIAKAYKYYPSAAYYGNKAYNNYCEDVYVGYRWFETFAKDTVEYPFGYGLSYTGFEIKCESAERAADAVILKLSVENTGNRPGRKVVQVYAEKPCGELGNPYRELAGFAKTQILKPDEYEKLVVKVPMSRLASYDSTGVCGCCSAYVLQAGSYAFAVGSNVRDAVCVYEFVNSENTVFEQLSEVSAPKIPFEIIRAKQVNGAYTPIKERVPTSTNDLKEIILERLPAAVPMSGDSGFKLQDVKEGKVSMDAFVAQLTFDELEALSRGDYNMDSPLGAKGNAGAFGGVTKSLRDKGVPAVVTTDGPSGIRLKTSCSLIPIGTALACSFDTELVSAVYARIGQEMLNRGSDVLLAPGMNIHRNPLCGRNFEYFSEDPLLTGLIAAAAVKGLQGTGVSACVKHFACNNQEYNRLHNDSRLSERALREIYLKGFEICVKEARPKNVMTSYNKINGVWGHYNYELCTSVLRGEWKYTGNVMTDWWMRPSKSPEFPQIRDNAYRVRAQVDVLMPGGKALSKRRKPDGTLLKGVKNDGITLGELQRSAKNVLNFILESSAFSGIEK